MLVALKEFTPVTKEEEKETTENSSQTDNENNTNNTDDISNEDENKENTNDTNHDDNSDNNDTNSNLSQSPTSSIISTTATSIHSDDEQDDILFRNNPNPNQPNRFDYKLKRPVINKKLSDISGIYNLQDLERMEREFVWRLGGNDKVTDKDIREYVEDNRHALGIC